MLGEDFEKICRRNLLESDKINNPIIEISCLHQTLINYGKYSNLIF